MHALHIHVNHDVKKTKLAAQKRAKCCTTGMLAALQAQTHGTRNQFLPTHTCVRIITVYLFVLQWTATELFVTTG